MNEHDADIVPAAISFLRRHQGPRFGTTLTPPQMPAVG